MQSTKRFSNYDLAVEWVCCRQDGSFFRVIYGFEDPHQHFSSRIFLKCLNKVCPNNSSKTTERYIEESQIPNFWSISPETPMQDEETPLKGIDTILHPRRKEVILTWRQRDSCSMWASWPNPLGWNEKRKGLSPIINELRASLNEWWRFHKLWKLMGVEPPVWRSWEFKYAVVDKVDGHKWWSDKKGFSTHRRLRR